MAKNTKISVLSIGNEGIACPIGDYAGYEKQIKAYLKRNIDKVLPEHPDIIILPEGCNEFTSKGFEDVAAYRADKKKYLNYLGDRLQDYMREIAVNNNTNIAYSAVRCFPEDERYPYRNSTIYIDRTGNIAGVYDKNHLVIEENSIGNTGYGTEAKVIELDCARVASAICFDLNFNELMEKYKAQHPELIVFCSAYHGGLKQEQWAYECQSYFAGAIAHAPGRIINPLGTTVAAATNYTDHVSAMVNLDYRLCHGDHNREKFVAAKAKYKNALTVYDPGCVGVRMLTYNDTDQTIEDVIDEFGIERLDDYFAMSRAHRQENM